MGVGGGHHEGWVVGRGARRHTGVEWGRCSGCSPHLHRGDEAPPDCPVPQSPAPQSPPPRTGEEGSGFSRSSSPGAASAARLIKALLAQAAQRDQMLGGGVGGGGLCGCHSPPTTLCAQPRPSPLPPRGRCVPIPSALLDRFGVSQWDEIGKWGRGGRALSRGLRNQQEISWEINTGGAGGGH